MVKFTLQDIVEAVFPPRCAGCQEPGNLLCVKCQTEIEPIKPPICEMCGVSLMSSGICITCQDHASPLAQTRAAVRYNPKLQTVIHEFKYNARFRLARPLAAMMEASWDQWASTLGPVDTLVPIPLHQTRLDERGYNQSKLLAERLGDSVGLSVESDLLARIRPTPPQARLSGDARRQNVQGAFFADSNDCRDRHILLIDDVYTTGSTLVSAAEACLTAGAARVSAFCLARAG